MLMPLLVQPLLSPLLIPPHCWPLRWTVHPGPSKCSPLHLPPLSCRLSYWSLIAGIKDPLIPNFIRLLIFPNNPEVSSQTMVVNTKPEMSMLIFWLWSPGVMVRCSEGNCRGIINTRAREITSDAVSQHLPSICQQRAFRDRGRRGGQDDELCSLIAEQIKRL